MADMISALKALYDALGGTLSNIPDGATNADVIEAIAAQIDEGGGGSSLPAVTSDDNGDVLTVVEGEWSKAAPSGGGSDIFVANFAVTWDEGTQSRVVTCDKTAEEVEAAATQTGKIIIGKALFNQTEPYIWTVETIIDEYHAAFYFTFMDDDGQGNKAMSYAIIYYNAGWFIEQQWYPLTPAT